jgi:hypothetical protein
MAALSSSLVFAAYPAAGPVPLYPINGETVSPSASEQIFAIVFQRAQARSAAVRRRGAQFCAGHQLPHAPFLPDTRVPRLSAFNNEGAGHPCLALM